MVRRYERNLSFGSNGAMTMTTKMLVLHAFRVISIVAFVAVAWWIAMFHHDGDFLTFAMIVVPLVAAVGVSNVLLLVAKGRWR
jgi:hypothetical protein